MHRFFLVVLVAWCVIVVGCSGGGSDPLDKTAAQLTAEGWQAFSVKNYPLANSKFVEALARDANFIDANNGSGWANARLNALSAAAAAFSTGRGKAPANLEIITGLAFVENAQKNYASSIIDANAVLQANPNWIFSRDASVSSMDLHLLLAENYFAQANYTSSLQQVQLLNSAFSADPSTSGGQDAIARELERLRSIV